MTIVNVTVTNAEGTSPTSSADQFTYTSAPAPTVTSLSPNAGPIAGGTSVAVTGTAFTGVTAVQFGSIAATSYTVNSTTSITAVAPAEVAGPVYVSVTNAVGTSPTSSANQYTYTSSAVLPSVSGATSVTDQSGNTYTIPSTLVFDDEFNVVHAGGIGGTDPTKWGINPYSYSDGSDMIASNVVATTNGVHLICNGPDGDGGLICTAGVGGNAGNDGTANPGYGGVPTAAHPIFIEFKALLAGNSTVGYYGWGALWASSQNWPYGGEIDIAELYGSANFDFEYVGPLFPGPDFPEINNPGSATHGYPPANTWNGGTHTWGILWAPASVSCYYDGVYQGTICNATVVPDGFDPVNIPGPLRLIAMAPNSSINGGAVPSGGYTHVVYYARVWQD